MITSATLLALSHLNSSLPCEALLLLAGTLASFNIRLLVTSYKPQHPSPSLGHHPFVIAYTFDLDLHPYHKRIPIGTAEPFAASVPRSFGSHQTLGLMLLERQLLHCWQQLEVCHRVEK